MSISTDIPTKNYYNFIHHKQIQEQLHILNILNQKKT